MLMQLTERCYVLPDDHATDRPALGYVRGDRKSLLIDGGNSPAHAALMRRELEKAGLPLPDIIAVTHSHWDHTYGLCAWEAPVVARPATNAQLHRMAGWSWSDEAMKLRLQTGEDIAFCDENIRLEYADPASIRVRTADWVTEKACFDLGGVEAVFEAWPSSHTEDCAVIRVPEEAVIFLGDITYQDLHHVPVCRHTARMHALIARLEADAFTWAVPGHQPPMRRDAFFADLHSTLAQERAEGLLFLEDA